jgi:hypothetical protein
VVWLFQNLSQAGTTVDVTGSARAAPGPQDNEGAMQLAAGLARKGLCDVQEKGSRKMRSSREKSESE